MKIRIQPLIALLVALLTFATARGESTDDALQRALASEGLSPGQIERIRTKMASYSAITQNKENNMDKPQPATDQPKRPFPVVPTTKILAWGRFTSPPTPEQVKQYFPLEVPATLKLYLEGKIDQWWVRQDQTGPVFLMNVTSIEEAHEILEKLPLGQAKLMVFDFTELGPLTPLHMLLKDGADKDGK